MHKWLAVWLMEPLETLGNRTSAILWLGWGIMLSYFPVYAHLHDWTVWAFYCVGLICYLSCITYAFIRMRNLLNNQLFSSVARVVLLIGLGVMAHFVGMQTDMLYGDGTSIAWLFKLFVLFCAMLALPSIFVCFRYFYDSQEKKKLLLETFTLKNVVTFVSATVAFLTILIPFIQVVLPLILPNVTK